MSALKNIDRNIRTITTNAAKLNMLIHETGVMVLEHAKEHGDCTRALALVKAMPASMRRTMLVLWFETYSPIRIREANDKVGILKEAAKGYTDWDIEGAKETPFFELANQNPEKSYSFEDLVKMVERLSKQIEKKIEEGKVPEGDVASAQALAITIGGLKVERVKPVANDAAAADLRPAANA